MAPPRLSWPVGRNQTQIREGRRIGRTQHGLAGERTLTAGIPHGLGCDAVSLATHDPLKTIHFFPLAISGRSCQAKHALPKAMDEIKARPNPSVLRKSG